MIKLIIKILQSFEKTDNKGINQIKKHEGYRSKLYKCSAGKITIGYGWNIEDTGIDKQTAELRLQLQVQDTIDKLTKSNAWIMTLDEPRKWVFINMCFNMGYGSFRQFKNTLTLAKKGDYEGCADNMIKSKWYKQVGNRSKQLVKQMRSGQWSI